jgi:hypothetical protein
MNALAVNKIEGRPGWIDPQAYYRMFQNPSPFRIAQCDSGALPD